MASIQLLFSSSILFSFLLFSLPFSRSETTPLITYICSRAEASGQDFCLKTLSSNPQAIAAKEAWSIVLVACDLGYKYATEAQNVFKNKQKDSTLSLSLKKALDDCVGAYDVILRDFKMAPREGKEDAIDANYDIKIISDSLSLCRNSLQIIKEPEVKEISHKNEVTYKYVQIGVAATISV